MYISFQPEPGQVMVLIASQKKKVCVVNCKKNQVRLIRYGNLYVSCPNYYSQIFVILMYVGRAH